MKKFILFILLLSSIHGISQSNFNGFSYQAVVRTDDGKAFNNTEIEVLIDLFEVGQEKPVYSEKHKVTTDRFGQINLVVGNGEVSNGDFQKVPWDGANIFYKVQLLNSDEDLDIISEAEILAVPYALYAKSAGSISNSNISDDDEVSNRNPNSEKFWSLQGNKNPVGANTLGTLNWTDLNIVTNSQTRIFISQEGQVDVFAPINFEKDARFGDDVLMNRMLQVNDDVTFGKNAFVGGSLSVKKEVEVEGNIDILGDISVYGNARFESGLGVGGLAVLDGGVVVGMMTPTQLTGTLTVDKTSQFNDDVTIEGKSQLNNDLTVEGESNLKNKLFVSTDAAQGSYVAEFENTNNGNGDGINIKLGKSKTVYAPPAFSSPLTPAQEQQIRDLIRCDYTGNKITLLGNIVLEGLQADIQMLAGLAVGIGNFLIDFMNASLGLPITINAGSIIGSINLFYLDLGALGTVNVNLPALPPNDITIVPSIPTLSLSDIGIPEIPINDLGFWGVPNLCLNDAPGSSPLNNQNEFIRFSDNNDAKMGSIKAVSLTDWSSDYLNPVFLFSLHGALTSAVDKKHGRYHFKQEVSKALKAYASIGVEYSSGNGDYAEWLPRINENEKIYPGEIVGVVGGEITKDLAKAEQVMVVSHNPIVLGNTPEASRVKDGNNIAFMGQVPVKITGPVRTGDYIVADPEIPGYGYAKNEFDMTVEDFKYAVGRSWDNHTEDGPKMVNTVVGIHNGDYTKILKNMERKFDESENRLETLEDKVEVLSRHILQTSKEN